jgi:hypothetical protein
MVRLKKKIVKSLSPEDIGKCGTFLLNL